MFATLRLPLITSLRWAISAVSGNDSSPTGVIFISLTPINFTLLREEREENIRNDLWHTQKKKKKKETGLDATLKQRLINSPDATPLICCTSQSGNSLVLRQDFEPFVLFFFFFTCQGWHQGRLDAKFSDISDLTHSASNCCCGRRKVLRIASENNWNKGREVQVYKNQ